MLGYPRLEDAVRTEDIDNTMPLSGDVVVLFGILNCICHINVAAEVLDAEGRVPGGTMRILEGTRKGSRAETRIKHLHGAGPATRSVNQAVARGIRGSGQTFLNG